MHRLSSREFRAFVAERHSEMLKPRPVLCPRTSTHTNITILDTHLVCRKAQSSNEQDENQNLIQKSKRFPHDRGLKQKTLSQITPVETELLAYVSPYCCLQSYTCSEPTVRSAHRPRAKGVLKFCPSVGFINHGFFDHSLLQCPGSLFSPLGSTV